MIIAKSGRFHRTDTTSATYKGENEIASDVSANCSRNPICLSHIGVVGAICENFKLRFEIFDIVTIRIDQFLAIDSGRIT